MRISRNRYGVIPLQSDPAQTAPRPRRTPIAILTATALLGMAFVAGPLSAEVGLTADGCNTGKTVRQLAAARDTRTQTRALMTRLAVSGDPRQQDVARELAGLGFTPATQPPGWRQKAVDVSDQLNGTSDPQLHKIAVVLAKEGLGPTPADLLPKQPPPPGDEGGTLEGIGQSLGGAADNALGAVESAGEAVQEAVAPSPAVSSSGSGKGPAAANPNRQAEPPLPETTCTDQAEATAAPAAVTR